MCSRSSSISKILCVASQWHAAVKAISLQRLAIDVSHLNSNCATAEALAVQLNLAPAPVEGSRANLACRFSTLKVYQPVTPQAISKDRARAPRLVSKPRPSNVLPSEGRPIQRPMLPYRQKR